MLFKSEIGSNKRIHSWVKRFRAIDCENENFVESFRIAIARKGPRLCELIDRFYEEKEGFSKTNIVSEHAIPFIFDELQGIDRVKLADEAIYYGTTFVRIYTVLLTGLATLGRGIIPKDEVKAVPALVSNEKEHFWNENLTFDVQDLNEFSIAKEEIPEFINGLIDDFLKLRKPFDIEFPIFYLKVKPEFLADPETVRKFVCKVAGVDENVSNIYCNHHYVNGEDYYNISWLVTKEPYRNRNLVEPDFIKFRFFPDKGNERLGIVCYAPHLFPDNCISENSPLFTDPQIKSIWKAAWEKAKSLRKSEENTRKEFLEEYRIFKDEYRQYLIADKYPGNDLLNWSYQLEEYEYHRTRSFIIFANYLLSFQKAQDFSGSIRKAAHEVFEIEEDKFEFGIEASDLAYLVGNRLGEDFALRLNACYGKKDIASSFIRYMGVLKDYQVMPDKYILGYEQANRKIMAKCRNLSELISVGFSNIHKYVELAGRSDVFENLDRLRFGESFSTLYYRAFAYFPEAADLYCKVHQCMDFRIDNGSVVPKYVCQKDHPDKPWLRLFRSGENEDKMLEQQLRLFSIILDKLYTRFETVYLSEPKIALAFNLILNEKLFALGKQEADEPDDVANRLLSIHYRIDPNKMFRVPVFETEINGVANRDVLSFCLDFELIKLINSGDGYVFSGNNDFLTFKKRTEFFDERLIEYIDEQIELVFNVYQSVGDYRVEELLNWLYISDQQLDMIARRLEAWIENFSKKERAAEPIDLEDVALFYKIYEAFPVESDLFTDEERKSEVNVFVPEWKERLEANMKHMRLSSLYNHLQKKGELLAENVQQMVEYFFQHEQNNSAFLYDVAGNIKRDYNN